MAGALLKKSSGFFGVGKLFDVVDGVHAAVLGGRSRHIASAASQRGRPPLPTALVGFGTLLELFSFLSAQRRGTPCYGNGS